MIEQYCSPKLTDYVIQEARTTDLIMVKNILHEQTFFIILHSFCYIFVTFVYTIKSLSDIRLT
jgi:hypothetical protein